MCSSLPEDINRLPELTADPRVPKEPVVLAGRRMTGHLHERYAALLIKIPDEAMTSVEMRAAVTVLYRKLARFPADKLYPATIYGGEGGAYRVIGTDAGGRYIQYGDGVNSVRFNPDKSERVKDIEYLTE